MLLWVKKTKNNYDGIELHFKFGLRTFPEGNKESK